MPRYDTPRSMNTTSRMPCDQHNVGLQLLPDWAARAMYWELDTRSWLICISPVRHARFGGKRPNGTKGPLMDPVGVKPAILGPCFSQPQLNRPG